ncbi:GNAT family N-acetyltransferase [Celeribacter persicus]|jgi:Acetyltransferases|uniref:Ribosomal protein S18 acetylase RimI-like enzyme n=1 Tax=Celeribacter persicus TaxID=1651082 RepID=A0A2T5HUF2_9RHOB|nr:GNAT family N-acetyltransferase [Celeribacter persicus]PTQ75207.1 ribosomal protein S18 acetylase RimI-like enzyme [Celeribacter persicus]
MSRQTPLAVKGATPALTIRAAEGRDVPRLMDMINDLKPLTEDRLNLDEASVIDLIHAPKPWVRLLVAEQDGELIGYAALVGGLQLSAQDRAMEMHHIYVEPAHRGQGIGRALSDAAMTTARMLGCETLTVAISRTSAMAKAAYRAFGFERPSLRAPRYVMPV